MAFEKKQRYKNFPTDPIELGRQFARGQAYDRQVMLRAAEAERRQTEKLGAIEQGALLETARLVHESQQRMKQRQEESPDQKKQRELGEQSEQDIQRVKKREILAQIQIGRAHV